METHPLFNFERSLIPIVSAKQLNVSVCKLEKAIELNALWHSVFPIIEASNCYRNKICIAFSCDYDGAYFASAIWTSPVAANRMTNGDKILELRRMAISDKAPKYNATRFLSKMQKHIKKLYPELCALVSYQDKERHTGTIYKASNWHVDCESKFTDWSTSKRNRAAPQSKSAKIRWRFNMKTPKGCALP